MTTLQADNSALPPKDSIMVEDHRLTLFIASSSIIILTLIAIIGVVSCFILCNEQEFIEITMEDIAPLRTFLEVRDKNAFLSKDKDFKFPTGSHPSVILEEDEEEAYEDERKEKNDEKEIHTREKDASDGIKNTSESSGDKTLVGSIEQRQFFLPLHLEKYSPSTIYYPSRHFHHPRGNIRHKNVESQVFKHPRLKGLIPESSTESSIRHLEICKLTSVKELQHLSTAKIVKK